MITAEIVDQGTIDTSLPPTTDPLYQVAALSLFYRQMFAALRTAGFSFKRPQTSDLTTFNTNMNDWLDDANARFDAWLQGAVGEVISNVPDVLLVGEALVTGGASAVGSIVLEKMLNHMFHVEDSRAQYEGAHENVDTAALEAKLEEIRLQMEEILTQFNINIFADEYQQTWSVGPVEPD